jgi:hypothetical protein
MIKTQTLSTEGPLAEVASEPLPSDKAVWTLPTSSKVGWQGLSAAQLRDAAFADPDHQLA